MRTIEQARANIRSASVTPLRKCKANGSSQFELVVKILRLLRVMSLSIKRILTDLSSQVRTCQKVELLFSSCGINRGPFCFITVLDYVLDTLEPAVSEFIFILI